MHYDREAIVAAIENALAASDRDTPAVAHDIAFHMTDWLDDLSALQAFYADPGHYRSKQVVDLLLKFLLHAPHHVAAAAKLLTDEPVTDVFGIGATADRS